MKYFKIQETGKIIQELKSNLVSIEDRLIECIDKKETKLNYRKLPTDQPVVKFMRFLLQY